MQELIDLVKPNIASVPSFSSAEGPTARFYIHISSQTAFSSETGANYTQGAKTHALDIYSKYMTEDSKAAELIRKRFQFLIGVVWGTPGQKMIEFTGIERIPKEPEKWPGNQDARIWVTRNGVMVPDRENLIDGIKLYTCGDGRIISSIEEVWRRKCRSFEEYAGTIPRGL